jgi:phenylacetate-CoA ligase
MNIRELKNRVPESLKMPYRYAVGIIPYSWRYGGKRYKETRQFLIKSQWWSEDQHQEYQLKELKRLLCHAYKNIPYYKRKFESIHCLPDDIKSIENFHNFPFLAKEDLRNNLDELKATNIQDAAMQYETSGGSTGHAVGFYEQIYERKEIELAFTYALWGRIGYKPGDRIGVLRGNLVPKRNDGSHWLFNPKINEFLLSSYHLTEKSAELYAKLINKFRVKYLHVYPSAITLFAKYLDGLKMSFPYLKGILCASEMIYDWQRKSISEVFNCSVFSHYGLSERAVLGGECEYTSKIHIFPEYGYTELIDEKGNQITEAKIPGEIVATGFTNYATPFIRYRTGDIGILSAEKCSCGRNYPLFEHIEGRTQDFVITEKGKKITLTALIFAQHFHAFGRLKKLQIEQNVPGKITMRIVKDAGFSRRDEYEIRQKI